MKCSLVVIATIQLFSIVENVNAKSLQTTDENFIQVCLATTRPVFERYCINPTDAERIVVGAEGFFDRDRQNQLSEGDLSKLGRWWAIVKASAKYCDGENGEIAKIELNLQTQYRLDALVKSSQLFARDHSIGEITATRMIEAAKLSALSELGIRSPSDTWYCAQPFVVLPFGREYAPPTFDQAADIDELLTAWRNDPTPAVANKDELLVLINNAPQDQLHRLFGATRAMGNKSYCVPDELSNEWNEIERKFTEVAKLDDSLNKLRRSGRDWSNVLFVIEERVAAQAKLEKMTPSERIQIALAYQLTDDSDIGDWQTALNEVRENAAYDVGKMASCVLFKREFGTTLDFAKGAKK